MISQIVAKTEYIINNRKTYNLDGGNIESAKLKQLD